MTAKQRVGRAILKAFGWRAEGSPPTERRFVMVAAPHTSNWDLLFLVAGCLAEDVPIRWLGKDSLFKGPVGKLLQSVGGIAVVRHERHDMVSQLAALLADESQGHFALVVPPEATRSAAPFWRSGFYRIAERAQVPIVLGFLDYSRKAAGFGPALRPSGDIAADMQQVRAFYADKLGKFPDRFMPPRMHEE